MAEHIRERYGIALKSRGSIHATEQTDSTIAVRSYDGTAGATLKMTAAEVRRFASMLLVLAARAEGDIE